VFFNTQGAGLTAAELSDRARKHGVAVSTNGKYRVRACTHLDVTAADMDMAVQVIGEVVKAA
jgi:threonine aldolase